MCGFRRDKEHLCVYLQLNRPSLSFTLEKRYMPALRRSDRSNFKMSSHRANTTWSTNRANTDREQAFLHRNSWTESLLNTAAVACSSEDLIPSKCESFQETGDWSLCVSTLFLHHLSALTPVLFLSQRQPPKTDHFHDNCFLLSSVSWLHTVMSLTAISHPPLLAHVEGEADLTAAILLLLLVAQREHVQEKRKQVEQRAGGWISDLELT